MLTYAQLTRLALAYVTQMKAIGIGPGARVALDSGDVAVAAPVVLGCALLGASWVSAGAAPSAEGVPDTIWIVDYKTGKKSALAIKRIATGDGAHAFRSMGDGRHVFVSNRVANTISQIDHVALAVVAELPGPGGPDCMELLADRRTLLVSSRWARKLSFVDIETRKVVRQVDVGRSPHGVWTLDHAPR